MKRTTTVLLLLLFAAASAFADPIDIGNRRELLVDDYLIESIDGAAALILHHPVAKEIVLDHDSPWEGTGCGYNSIFKDGDKYRMYYKAWHLDVQEKKLGPSNSFFTCYAESKDGIKWVKPNLGLIEFPKGSGNNNIVIAQYREAWMKETKPDPVHPAIFKDENCARRLSTDTEWSLPKVYS